MSGAKKHKKKHTARRHKNEHAWAGIVQSVIRVCLFDVAWWAFMVILLSSFYLYPEIYNNEKPVMAMIAVDCTLVYILRLWLVPGITSTRCPGAYFYTLECLLCCWLDALVRLDDLDRLLELEKPEDALAVEPPRPQRSKRAKTSDNGTRPTVRYPEDVSDNDMDKFMEALSSVDSQEGLLRKLTELGIDSKIKQCFRKIWLYLRNNPSATFPDWLQSPFNDVMNGFFRDAGKKFDAFEEGNGDLAGNREYETV